MHIEFTVCVLYWSLFYLLLLRNTYVLSHWQRTCCQSTWVCLLEENNVPCGFQHGGQAALWTGYFDAACLPACPLRVRVMFWNRTPLWFMLRLLPVSWPICPLIWHCGSQREGCIKDKQWYLPWVFMLCLKFMQNMLCKMCSDVCMHTHHVHTLFECDGGIFQSISQIVCVVGRPVWCVFSEGRK